MSVYQGWFAQSKSIHPHTALRLLTLSLPFRPQPGHRSAAYGRNIRVVRYCTRRRPAGLPAQPDPPPQAAPANSVRFAAFFEDVNVRLSGRRAECADGATHYCTTTRRGRFRLGRKPVAKRVNRTLARIDEVLRKRWHHDIWEVRNLSTTLRQ